MGYRYSFNQLIYKIQDEGIEELVYADSVNSLIKTGTPYDIDRLENERTRITKNLQNNGYYAFSKDQVYFEADSSIGSKKVDITLKIKPNRTIATSDSIINTDHVQFYISAVYVHTQFDPNRYVITDTMGFKGYHFVQSAPHRKKPDRDQFIKFTTITQKVFFKKGSLFSISDLESTYSHLGGLQLFKFINISFIQKGNGDSLDCIIQLTPVPKQYFSIETEGTHSSGNLGVGTNLVYNNKNTLKGAEILEIRFKGALEAQKTFAVSEDKEVTPIDVFNTIEAGPEIKYHIPRLLFPIKAEKIPKRYDPKTVISTAYNFQRRTDFTRSIANFSFGYEWKESAYKTHILAPIEISSIKIADDSPILDTINSISNDFIRYSFIDHLTTATRYSFIYNNQQLGKKRNFTYLRGNAEFAGNTLRVLNTLLKSEITGDGASYEIFGIQYAQFMRFDADVRQYAIINQHNTIVFRLAAGMGITYGNSTVMPFEKSYFAGGANGIRAWQARDLGPGSYTGPTNFDQIGDIKIEANIESRFDIVGVFEGAAFIDIGNIWLMSADEDRPGAQFETSQFLNELAMGGGLGLRLNFSFFIIRLDAAIPIKDPAQEREKRWVLKGSSVEDINFNLGIGYPF
jgi:outer membrane protein assembly factor BamA